MRRRVFEFGWLVVLVVLTACNSSTSSSSGNVSSSNTTSANSSGNGAPSLKRIIFLTNGDDPFWDACNAGLTVGAKEHDLASAGLTAVMEKNNGTAQGQIEKLRQFASQSDIAGVAISVIQADNVAIIEEMRNLQKKGVKVITVDGDVNRDRFRDARPYYIGTDNIVGGRALGTAAKELLHARNLTSGGYVQFAGFTDNDNARNRMDGFQQAIGEAFAEKDRMPDGMDLTRARDNVRNALTNHQDLVALVGIWAYNAPAIAEIVQERNIREKMTVITFDAQPLAINHMSQGHIDAMVVQDPFQMGNLTARVMKAMVQGDDTTLKEIFPRQGEPDGDVFTTGLRVVVPDSGTPLKPEMFDSNTVEFLTLSEFKEWLKKFNLTGS